MESRREYCTCTTPSGKGSGKPLLRSVRHRYIEPALCRWVIGLGSLLPRKPGWAAAGFAGSLAAALPSRANRFMAVNIRRVASPLGLRVEPRRVYRHIAGGLIDFLRLSAMDDEAFRRIVSTEGAEHLDRVLARGRGAVVITAHYSAWELIPRAVSLLGHRVGVVGRKLWNPGVSAQIDSLRQRSGALTIDRSSGAVSLMRALRSNTAVGILVDQETKAVEGRFLPFLGVPALTPTGPAAICLRFGIPAVTLHIRRLGMKYRLVIEPPVGTGGLSGEEGVAELTTAFNTRIGKWITDDPEQWIWFHDRWGRSPAFRDFLH